MKKIKFMLLSFALIAVVGAALAFKARYSDTFCTTFAQQDLSGQYICSTDNVLSCPTKIEAQRIINVGQNPPVCTALPVNGTCGDAQNTVPCVNVTTSIEHD